MHGDGTDVRDSRADGEAPPFRFGYAEDVSTLGPDPVLPPQQVRWFCSGVERVGRVRIERQRAHVAVGEAIAEVSPVVCARGGEKHAVLVDGDGDALVLDSHGHDLPRQLGPGPGLAVAGHGEYTAACRGDDHQVSLTHGFTSTLTRPSRPSNSPPNPSLTARSSGTRAVICGASASFPSAIRARTAGKSSNMS